jgi:PPM family protein phosphatase
MVEIGTEPTLQALSARLFGVPPRPVRVEFGALSHPGKVRETNEDHYVVVRRRRSREVLLTNLPEGVLSPSDEAGYSMAVADGVGGAAFGEMASTLALQAAWDLSASAVKWPFQWTEGEAEELTQTLQLYGHLMHRRLVERGQVDPRYAGMATTITGAITIGAEAFIAHVGDSRAYLVRDGVLDRLTRDHTMAQRLVDAGDLPSVSEAPGFMRRLLVNCLGGRRKDDVEVDVRRVHLADGDRLLFCTDGLTDMVREADIARALVAHPRPEDACRTLVDLALDGGGRDNVTVVLARFTIPPTAGEGPAPAAVPGTR